MKRGGVVLRRAARGTAARTAALIAAAVAAGALVVSWRFAIHAPTVRATIETALTAAALGSAWLLRSRYRQGRHVAELLLLAALVTHALVDTIFFAVPAMLDLRSASFGATAPLAARLLVAVLFAAAAVAMPVRGTALRRAVALPLLAAAALLALLPVHVALTVVGVLLLLLAAAALARAAVVERSRVDALLAVAMALLAAGWIHDLLMPALAPGWISAREILRFAAYAVMVAAGLACRAELRRATLRRAAEHERRRLARDLHDGLAQDLAFIAAHGERLADELGAEHPVAIAARRALAASRGAIVDLSSRDAPTAAAALRAVADELASRHLVRVSVEADDAELTAGRRDELVRIAREAIVNAIDHGGARDVVVSLRATGDRLVLRVDDDGCGIGEGAVIQPGRGFGLRAMHERAAALGGRLATRARIGGGTEIEVVV